LTFAWDGGDLALWAGATRAVGKKGKVRDVVSRQTGHRGTQRNQAIKNTIGK